MPMLTRHPIAAHALPASLALALALALAGCGSREAAAPADQIAFNDFEVVDGWSGGAPVPSLTAEQAHSGKAAVRVAPGLDYSFGYHNALGRMSPTRLAKVQVQAWVWLPDAPVDAMLVTQVRDPTQSKDLSWDGLALAMATKDKKKWVLVEKEVTLPEAATAKSELLVYLWRNSSAQPVYLDDLRILRAK